MPTAEACGSCHDDVDFATGEGHVAGLQPDNEECAGCHPESGSAASVRDTHASLPLLLSERFAYQIDAVELDAETRELTIDVSVTNPTDGDARYDLLADPEFTAGGGVSRLSVLVGWDTRDYTNAGSGRPVGAPVAINPLAEDVATPNGDGTYRLTAVLPDEAEGTGVVAVEGHPAGPDGEGEYTVRVPVRSALSYFAITDDAPVARRDVVDIETRCDNCHGVLSMHGANRTDEDQVCAVCHNPNATDINRRPEDHLDPETPTADGLKEQSIDFKLMIHAIHGAAKREAPYVVYGFGNREHVFSAEEVTFPGILNDCEACHVGESYLLPVRDGVLASTVDSDPTAATRADADPDALLDPADDLNVSPTAAVCSACHDSPLAAAHMMQNGAAFDALQSELE